MSLRNGRTRITERLDQIDETMMEVQNGVPCTGNGIDWIYSDLASA
ncbi:hypothetical protein, unlikely [Trypanosoma brucei brucei TREU927]|uniref:Uncharacterized protein n=1 Tax=Trypanosoma brucei brucei (strain 927/4 GUTat10.1) TaxID=185431 RepID=Q38DA4_TRYB2|nr:hypothetical protein, unlikely [Trypanosoma brucei brucei TREU927]EAN77216.1 hypothetical protein, unlikely [Trypanosoma brucei brucei TREU927]